MQSTAKWVDGLKSIVGNGRKHSLVIDVPESNNGTDHGPTALELVGMGLAGCISTIFAIVAANSGLVFSGLNVTVDAEKSDGSPTITAARAKVTIVSAEPEERIRRVLDKTMKTCPVGLLYEKAGVEIGVELTVTEPAVAA